MHRSTTPRAALTTGSAVLGALLVAGGWLGQPAVPAVAAEHGGAPPIAFASDRGGDLEIYAMTPRGEVGKKGKRARQLTRNTASDYDPVWSPNGLRLAFVSDRDGNGEIHAMDADGGNQANLTGSPDGDFAPDWSRQDEIAFARMQGGDLDIWVMSATGGGQRNLTDRAGHDHEPSWSPDGKQVAFASIRDGNWEIYVMDADGSDQTNLTRAASQDYAPTWSPDGSRIAFTTNRDGNYEVYTMAVDGTDPQRVTKTATNETGATWAANGAAMAVTTTTGQGSSRIDTVSLADGRRTRLTASRGVHMQPDWRAEP